MRRILQVAFAMVLHPVALVLALINIAGRTDLGTAQKILWAIVCFIWPIGAALYLVFGGGRLW